MCELIKLLLLPLLATENFFLTVPFPKTQKTDFQESFSDLLLKLVRVKGHPRAGKLEVVGMQRGEIDIWVKTSDGIIQF